MNNALSSDSIQSSIDILIPAFNEGDRLPATIAALRDAMPGRIIVVDDGSSDGTSEAAVRAEADVVFRLEENGGKGAALNEALQISTAPILLLVDADLAGSASCLSPLVDAVASGRCDMAVASFPQAGRKSGLGIAQGLARWGLRLRTGRTFTSPISGQRCVRRECVERLGGFADGFAVEVALTLGVLKCGGYVEEIPLPLSHRKTGRDWKGWRHRAKQAVAIVKALTSLSLVRTASES